MELLADLTSLENELDEIRRAPQDDGGLELIVRRPAVDEREVLDEALLDLEVGLVGDTWAQRSSSSSPDGGPHPRRQITIMNARLARAVAGPPERWALAGDQLYVDLDLSRENIPPGTRLAVGEAMLEVSPDPHRGCKKFAARFGLEALRFVNSEIGQALNLRGINTRVIVPGSIRIGDAVRKAAPLK